MIFALFFVFFANVSVVTRTACSFSIILGIEKQIAFLCYNNVFCAEQFAGGISHRAHISMSAGQTALNLDVIRQLFLKIGKCIHPKKIFAISPNFFFAIFDTNGNRRKREILYG